MKTSEHSAKCVSGNIFADLDLSDAEIHLPKVKLVSRTDDIFRQRGVGRREGRTCAQFATA